LAYVNTRTLCFVGWLRCAWRRVARRQPTSVVGACGPQVGGGCRSALSDMVISVWKFRCCGLAGLSTWNSLPDCICGPALGHGVFRRRLGHTFLGKYWWDVLSALEVFLMRMRYINLH